jgi:hypothetical protein
MSSTQTTQNNENRIVTRTTPVSDQTMLECNLVANREKQHTLKEGCSVNYPYTECYRPNNLVFVPDGNTSNTNERLIWGE